MPSSLLLPARYRLAWSLQALEAAASTLVDVVADYFRDSQRTRNSVYGTTEAFPTTASAQANVAGTVNWPAMAAVVVGATLLGFGAIFVKWAGASGATPLTVGSYRMLFALPGVYWLARRTGSLGTGQGRIWAILAGIAFFFDVWLWHVAMTHTSAANATLILGGLCPVWVALISASFFGLRYGIRGWVGQCIGLAGAVLLASARGARVDQGQGEAIAVAASFCYAVFTMLLGRSRVTLRAAQSLFWLTASAAVCFLFAALVNGDRLVGYTPRAWLSLIGLGLLVHLFAWWLNSWGLGLIDAALGALGLQAQQLGTLLLAAWLLDEPLRPLGVLGGLLIVGGIVANAFNMRRVQTASRNANRQTLPSIPPAPPAHATASREQERMVPVASPPHRIPGYGVLGRGSDTRASNEKREASQSRSVNRTPSRNGRDVPLESSELLRRRRSASWPMPVGWTLSGRVNARKTN